MVSGVTTPAATITERKKETKMSLIPCCGYSHYGLKKP
uniref:Uncharacterized protein n=1 Tax=Anguilla anguilla TaxID=7936 RepID=A0A0E9TUL4_ANGAN